MLIFGIILGQQLDLLAKPWLTVSLTLFVVAIALLVIIVRDQRRAINALEKAAAEEAPGIGQPTAAAAAAVGPQGAPAGAAGAAAAGEQPTAGQAAGPAGAAAGGAATRRERLRRPGTLRQWNAAASRRWAPWSPLSGW